MTDFVAVDTRSRGTPFYESQVMVTVEIDAAGRARITEIYVERSDYGIEVQADEFAGLGPFASADEALDAGLRIGVVAAGN